VSTALAEVTPYAVVSDAWQVYRRAQQVPFPGVHAGLLMKAQSRLFSLAEPSASGRVAAGKADLDAIEDAADNLVAVIEWACGTEAASFVAGDGDGRAA
jgi:hypothetical protein